MCHKLSKVDDNFAIETDIKYNYDCLDTTKTRILGGTRT